MSEQKIQTKIKKHLESDGWKVIKTIVLSEAGHPDLFCFKNGVTIFIEVKDKGKEPSQLQKLRIKNHIENGFVAFYADSYEKFLEQFKTIFL